jgi:hypothetical protein
MTMAVVAVPLVTFTAGSDVVETFPLAVTVRVSPAVPLTVCWAVFVVEIVVLAAKAEIGTANPATDTSIALRLTPHFQLDMIYRPQCRLKNTNPGLVEARNDRWMT